MSGHRTIAQQWATFERLVMPAGAGPVQRQEMRRAFYAGFQGALNVGTEIAAADLSDEAGAAVLQGLHEECQLFVGEIQAGRA